MDKKEKILEAALRLFVSLGFHGTPTSKIAQEAGVANGTLFHYFITKDELIVALYIGIKDRFWEYLQENANPSPDFKTTMRGHFLASLYWALENTIAFKYMEQFNTSPFVKLLPPGVLDKQMKPHHDLLRKGIKDKILKPLPVDFILLLITSHSYGLNQYLINNKFSKAKQHDLISDSFELLWDMIT